MADKSNQLILTALSRAAADDAVPLHGSKTVAGLFPTTAAGKQAAQRCQEDGYLRLVAEEDSVLRNGDAAGTVAVAKKKTANSPLCAITEKGLAYLLGQVSPRQVLEDFVRALEARQNHADDLMNLAQQMRQNIEALKTNVDKILQHTYKAEGSAEHGGAPGNLKALFAGFLNEAGSSRSTPSAPATDAALHETMLAELTRWQHANTSEDCPLPHLYRQLSPRSIGYFHDALRRLHDLGKIYLHPWTGPLYEIPEPPYALLIGHEIAYYASIRR